MPGTGNRRVYGNIVKIDHNVANDFPSVNNLGQGPLGEILDITQRLIGNSQGDVVNAKAAGPAAQNSLPSFAAVGPGRNVQRDNVAVVANWNP
jgi:hypothetical protein